MLLLVGLTLASRITRRSESVEVGASGAEATVQRCCCSEAEPEPKYLCYDKSQSKLYHPIEGNTKKSRSLPGLAGSGEEELSFRPKMLVTSTCGGSGNWTSTATQPASPLQVPTEEDYPGTNKLYRKAAPFEFTTYSFKDKSRYPKYTEKDFPRENHIQVNGVIYGPSDTHKAKDSMHGVPVCSMWERTAEVKVKTKGVKFSAKTNQFDYKLECAPVDICRDWVIAHACGFDHENVVLLKRVGRTGQCTEVESSLFGGTHCPKGTYHNSVAWGSGGFRFCDCDGPAECTVG